MIEGTGLDNTFALMTGYNRAIELCYEAWQYHFEFLNLGYAAYLDFFGFCKQAFPGISDLGIAKMVQGIEVDLFRPDDELRQLAQIAVEHGQDSDEFKAAFETREGPVVQLLDRQRLLLRRQGLARPPRHPARLHPRLRREAAGGREHRPADRGRRRRARPDHERVPRAAGRRRDARRVRREARALAARVPLRREPQLLRRALGAVGVLAADPRARAVLADAGFWADADDIFYVRRDELQQVIYDYGTGWAVGTEAAGPSYWPAEIARRKAHHRGAASPSRPQPALNQPPEVVTEPFTIMLYGITTDSVEQWLNPSGDARRAGRHGRLAGHGRGRRAGDLRRLTTSTRCSRARSWSPASRRRAGARCSAASRRPSPTSAG